MPLIPQVIQSITSRTSSQPRTILGFLFAIYSAMTVAAVVLVVALVGTDSSWLIGFIVAYLGITGVGLLIAVMRQAAKDASGLQVGQLTGSEYESLRRLTLGDSATGERTATLPRAGDVVEGTATEDPTPLIQPRPESPDA